MSVQVPNGAVGNVEEGTREFFQRRRPRRPLWSQDAPGVPDQFLTSGLEVEVSSDSLDREGGFAATLSEECHSFCSRLWTCQLVFTGIVPKFSVWENSHFWAW